jgi:hypothetical protein
MTLLRHELTLFCHVRLEQGFRSAGDLLYGFTFEVRMVSLRIYKESLEHSRYRMSECVGRAQDILRARFSDYSRDQ